MSLMDKDTMSNHLEIKLEHFEGPLDLLLHLIKKLEVDIYDIPIAEVTNQYVSYIKEMKNQQLSLAGEFLVMASTLMAIKSEWLIPRIDPQSVEEEDIYDPRQPLTDMLVEYQFYKDVAEQLKGRQEKRQSIYTKEPSDLSHYNEKVPLESASIDPDRLHQAFLRAQRRYQLMHPADSLIDAEEISIEGKMMDIEGKVKAAPERSLYFSECIDSLHHSHLVVSFLSLLELIKQRVIQAFQADPAEDILLKYIGGDSHHG